MKKFIVLFSVLTLLAATSFADKNDKNQQAWNALKSTFSSLKDGRYYRSSKGVVYDKKTQLLWQDNEDAKKVKKSWNDAKSYCHSLSLAGFDDWRLPSQKELRSIVDFSRYNPAIKRAFENVNSDNYWSSITDASDVSYAWSVSFGNGNDGWNLKFLTPYSVRCVR